MLHCPFCGAIVKDNEQYCVSCGEHLPDDLTTREQTEKFFNFFWFIPIASIIVVLTTIGIYYMVLQNKTNSATTYYEQATANMQKNEFEPAQKALEKALNLKANFQAAEVSLAFIEHSIQIEADLDEARIHQTNNEFEDALLLLNQAESSLDDFHGEPVTKLLDHILDTRQYIKLSEIEYKLEDEPNIDALKSLLLETEALKDDKANDVADDIRTQIVDFMFSKASEQLNNNQFSDAQLLVEDGLKYAADSEKLLSLKTTIEKEKTAFETLQEERIEQAMNMAAEEHEVNQSDAVELKSIKLRKDGQDKLVVKGDVNSIATIPIHSVVIEYTLISKEDEEILTNKVFIYPDKLYPNETGKFEFTHYELENLKPKDIDVKVNKITWYTD